jgi:hypothetical protein
MALVVSARKAKESRMLLAVCAPLADRYNPTSKVGSAARFGTSLRARLLAFYLLIHFLFWMSHPKTKRVG